jgi:4-amino-4-deoxy-L-arabinose transferase-like glycosyltransferase
MDAGDPQRIATTLAGDDRSLGAFWRHVVVLVLLQAVVGAIYLGTVPRFFNDEAWEASLGHSVAFEGRLRHGFIEGWGGMDVHFVQNQVILPFVTAGVYRIAGFSIVTSRAASLLVSVLAVVCIYGAMRRLFGARQAFWMAALTIAHPWFFEISRRVRPEIYFVALAAGAGWCWVRSTTDAPRRSAAAAGILAGLAALAHPTGGVLCVSLGVAAAIWLRGEKAGRRAAWAVAGVVLAVLPYVIYVVWACADPRVNFLEQMRGGQPAAGASLVGAVAGEATRWGHFFQWPLGAPLGAVMLLAWAAAWRGSTRADKMLATTIVVFAVAMPFTTVNLTSRYLVALTPLFVALLIRLVARIAGTSAQRPGRARLVGAAGIVAVYALMSAGAIGLMFHRLRGADFTRVVDRIASVTGSEDRVIGDLAFWMSKGKLNYGPFPLTHEWVQTPEMVRPCGFRYAVRAAWRMSTSHGISVPPEKMPDWRDEKDRAIDEICRRFGRKVDAFRDPHFGPIEIYELDWPASP